MVIQSQTLIQVHALIGQPIVDHTIFRVQPCNLLLHIGMNLRIYKKYILKHLIDVELLLL